MTDLADEIAARAETLAADWLWNFGRRDDARAAAERALAHVRDAPPSPAKIGARTAPSHFPAIRGMHHPGTTDHGTGPEAL